MESLQNLEFIWPWVFIALPLPWILSLLNIGSTNNNNKQAKLSAATGVRVSPLLASALSDVQFVKTRRFNMRAILLWVCWVLLLLALARPVMLTEKTLLPASGRALSLVIDLSGSMERRDFVVDEVQTDRLTAVKKLAADFLQQRQGDRVSLVLYADTAFISAPLSFDLMAISNLLASSGIGMAGRATAIGDALGLAVRSLRNDSAPEKAIILLSDGTNNAGSAEPESAAQLAGSLGIRVHSIGLGSEQSGTEANGFQTAPSADLDEDALKAIAEASGGQFFRATTTAELASVYQHIDELEGGDSRTPPLLLKSDVRNYPLLLLLLTSLLLAGIEAFRNRIGNSRIKSRTASKPGAWQSP